MREIGVAPSDDVGEAAWIGPRLRHFNEHVSGSVVPTGYDAYARIDHERDGVLPELVAAALVRVLAGHTSSPDSCWMALWDGYGYVDVNSKGHSWQVLFAPATEGEAPTEQVGPGPIPPQRPRSAPRLRLPNRDYVLYKGTLGQVPGWIDGPNLWWPEDRTWFVASEIDLAWTYVGGPLGLINELIAEPHVSAKPATTDETWTGGER